MQVSASFADMAVVGDTVPVPQGLYFAAPAISVFGLLNCSIDFQLAPTIVKFDLEFDDAQLLKVGSALVVSTLPLCISSLAQHFPVLSRIAISCAKQQQSRQIALQRPC